MPDPRRRDCRWLIFLLAAAAFPSFVCAQLTTGILEGTVRDPDGHARGGFQIVVSGSLQFRAVIETNADGEFVVVLPYGKYLLAAGDGGRASGVRVAVGPLQTTRLDLWIDGSGGLHDVVQRRSPGVWSEAERARGLPGATTLEGLLLNQEPASVTEPLDFTGLSDNRVGLESQRGYSWTDTQFKLLGMDATDSYQPGRPVIVPDIDALEGVVVRSDFAQTTSTSYGTEVGVFPAQPDASWHGALATADTGGFLSSSNLPPPAERGMVQQAERFRWFTHDSVQVAGPIAKWADLFATGGGQWSMQTVPLAPPGNNQRSRLLWGDVRSRIRSGARDRFDALYSGSRINLNNWGMPDGMEELVGRRMSPEFDLPGGFDGQNGADHFDFLQAGWTHRFSEDHGLGVLEVRYGYSIAHVDADPAEALGDSTTDLVTGAVTGSPPMFTRAVRSRQSVAGDWQPVCFTAAGSRHQIVAGAGWKSSSPQNRIIIPNNVNLITVNGAPAEVVEFETPDSSRSIIRSFESYAGDHVQLAAGLSLDLGILGDLSRGSIPANGNGQFVDAHPAVARPDLIVWNSVSPRAGFAWQVPHLERLLLRATYFRLYSPLAGRYLDFGNPNSLNGSVYQWIDRSLDGQFEPGDVGTLLMRFGGAYSSISPSLQRPYADEFNLGAAFTLVPGNFAGIHLFRRDDKQRIAAIDTGAPASAFTPVTIIDPGPSGILGAFDNRPLVVYDQNPATLGKDEYLLTNPPGLRTESTGFVAEVGSQWRSLLVRLSFEAERTYGPTNPGNAVFENDPGVIGALYMDPNTTAYAPDRSFTDRAYVGKMQASYTLPKAWGGIEVGSTVAYMDGLLFRRDLLVTGLAQGPFLLPVGDNRAEYAADWNLRILRAFRLPLGRIEAASDILNVINAGRKIQENDISGPSFNLRLPTAIQEPRQVRLVLRYEF